MLVCGLIVCASHILCAASSCYIVKYIYSELKMVYAYVESTQTCIVCVIGVTTLAEIPTLVLFISGLF